MKPKHLLLNRPFWPALLLLTLLLATTPAMAAPPRQDTPITYLRYDVAIEVQANGNFIVYEIQEIQFNGTYKTAFAEIPRDYTTDIKDIYLYTEDALFDRKDRVSGPGTYSVDKRQDAVEVSWGYEDTAPGEVRTFILRYEVEGGLWVYPDETILEWRAVPADRSGFPVLDSKVIVTLPDEKLPGDLRYTAYGPAFTAGTSEQQIAFIATEAIPDGTRFQVQVGFPPSLTIAQPQQWQIDEDNAKLQYRIEAIDVNLDIAADGRVSVTELQKVAVDAGALYQE